MPLYAKILIILGSILIFGLLGFIIYNQQESAKRQAAIESQIVLQKELVDKIVRSQSEYTSKKDLEEFIKNNGIALSAVKKDLDKLNAQVDSMNIILITSSAQKVTNLASSSTGPENPDPVVPMCKDGTPCPNADPFGYLKVQQNRTLFEDFGQLKLPIGSVGFSAWKDKPWTLDIKGREYNIATVVGKDENQRSYFYNKVTVNIDGTNYELPIKQALSKQEYPSAKWHWWNPRLFLTSGIGVSVNELSSVSLNMGATVAPISYGKFKNNPDISVMQVGIIYQTKSQKPALLINPINFNIGKVLSLNVINNTYVGPSVQLDITKNIFAGINVSVGL